MRPHPIDGATTLTGLLGYPVAHSVSPLIHNHAFAVTGVNGAYIPMPVSPSQLPFVVYALRSMGFLGANVTIPHKQRIIPYCDRLTEAAAGTGAVNTLFFRDGMLWGDTTDAEGFLTALAAEGRDMTSARVVVLGNGGAARSIGYAIAMHKQVTTLAVIGRNETRVSALAGDIAAKTGFAVSWSTFHHPDAAALLARCTLLVNCTPVGMHPHIDASPLDGVSLHRGMHVFDTIYNPAHTKLLSLAQQAGCSTQNGLRMLLYQALASFERWTGIEVDATHFDLSRIESHIAQST
jgi:shikimate dehydrogenase